MLPSQFLDQSEPNMSRKYALLSGNISYSLQDHPILRSLFIRYYLVVYYRQGMGCKTKQFDVRNHKEYYRHCFDLLRRFGVFVMSWTTRNKCYHLVHIIYCQNIKVICIEEIVAIIKYMIQSIFPSHDPIVGSVR